MTILLLAVFAAAAPAKTHFIGPDGTPEGQGTREAPYSLAQFREITGMESLGRNAALTLRGGDEVIFLDGTYSATGPEIRNARGIFFNTSVVDAHPKRPVVFRAENRHKAVFHAGTPITDWRKIDDGVWACTIARVGKQHPPRLFVNGDFILCASGRRGAGEWVPGMYKIATPEDELEEVARHWFARKGGRPVEIHVKPWDGEAPARDTYVYYGGDTIIAAGHGVVIDGFVMSHSGNGFLISGRHVTLRNLIVRDIAGQGISRGGDGWCKLEDSIFYNCGAAQTDHGIYVSGTSHRLEIRRTIWWRIAGAAIHVYSGGEGIDEPSRITCEYNIIGPDKLGRCWGGKPEWGPYNRKSCGFYIYGGRRWAGYNRVTNNLIFGGHARGISTNKCHFNLIANNTVVDIDDYALQAAWGMGNFVYNNVMEPGRAGYYYMWDRHTLLNSGRNLFLKPADADRQDRPVLWRFNGEQKWVRCGNLDAVREFSETQPGSHLEEGSVMGAPDPFVDRAAYDFRLKPGGAGVDAGLAFYNLHNYYGEALYEGEGPDIGAYEGKEPLASEKSKWPAIPDWLLKEHPIGERRKHEKHFKGMTDYLKMAE